MFLTIIWIIAFVLYIDTQIGWGNVEVLLPSEQGGLVAGLTAPLGFLWLFLAFVKRGTDVERHTEALQSELRKLSYPLTDAEAKTMRIADALRRQVDMLNAASDGAQQRLEQTGAALEAQAGRVSGLAEALAGKVAVARDGLAAETRNIDEHIAGVGKALRGHVADLEIQLADAGRRLEDQASGFSSQVESARRALADPADELAALGDKLAAQPAAFAKSAREQSAAIIAAFQAAGERFEQTTRGQGQVVTAAFDIAGERFAENTRDQAALLVGAAGRAANELEAQLRGKAEAMNALFDRLVEQGRRAQDAVQAHLSDLAQAGQEAEAIGGALRANLQDNVAAIRDSAAEFGQHGQGSG